MSKVWVVWDFTFDAQLKGIFTTEEKATEFAEKTAKPGFLIFYSIEEWELDDA